MLVAAMNPCPCGYYGDAKRECRCGSRVIEKYRQKISGPLLDRFDMHIALKPVDPLPDGVSGEVNALGEFGMRQPRAYQGHFHALQLQQILRSAQVLEEPLQLHS